MPWRPHRKKRTWPSPSRPPLWSERRSEWSCHGRCARLCRRSRAVCCDRIFLWPCQRSSCCSTARGAHPTLAGWLDFKRLSRGRPPADALASRPAQPALLCSRGSLAGADVQNRTGDLVLTKDALCHLSYIGKLFLVLSSSSAFASGPAEARSDSLGWLASRSSRSERRLERETGIE